VALLAFHSDVLALERIVGRVVFLDAEERRLPAIDVVTLRAFTFFGPGIKLALVRIGFVTVVAICERQRLLEVPVEMAFRTANSGVFPKKGIFGFGVIKRETLQNLFPCCSGVTVFAAFWLERALVRIDVAVDTFGKLHVLVAHRAARDIGLVALFTSHLNVPAGEWIASLGVIELLGGFPVDEVVTLQAVVPELTFVRILVTGHAILRKPEEGPGKILHFDERTLCGNHVHGRVTLFACNAGVLPFQVVAGQPVIELFLRGFPMDESKVLAVVLQVATDAIFAVGIAHLDLKVIAMLGVEASGNFLVAIETLESGSAGAELMATGALRSSGQRLVRFR